MSIKNGFTLIELIIVIIIVGILATVGLNQYTVQVEMGRFAEAKAAIGAMRKLAAEYYMKNGALSAITNTDLNIGTGSSNFPSACTTTNFYRYAINNGYADRVYLYAYRCTTGGKPPQGVAYGLCWRVPYTGSAIQYAYYNNGGSWVYTADWSGCCR